MFPQLAPFIVAIFQTIASPLCTLDNLRFSIGPNCTSTGVAAVTVVWPDRHRHKIHYCKIDQHSASIDGPYSCSGRLHTRQFIDGLAQFHFDCHQTYAVQVSCLMESTDGRGRLSHWAQSPFKLVNVDQSTSPVSAPSAIFLRPDKSWKTSERSALVILIIGASAIALGVPFALYIACRQRREEERKRNISMVSGAMR